MRTETGGACAAFLLEDRRVLAVDAAVGALEGPEWRGIVSELWARWERSPDLVRRDLSLSAHGAIALAFWLEPHGMLLVELGPGSALGLARLRLRPHVEALEAVLAGRTSGDDGEGSAAHPL